MNEIKMDKEFQNLFPTVSRDEYITLIKDMAHESFRNKEELFKWVILQQIERKDLSLYIKCLYALKYKELVEKEMNKDLNSLQTPLTMSNKTLAKETKLSRDAIDKIIAIDKYATDEQRNRLFNEKSTLNKIFYELRPELKKAYKSDKDKAPILNKICNECGDLKPISKFYNGRGICKVCYNEKEYSRYTVTDAKGNVVKVSEEVNNLTKKYSEKIENDLYDINKHMEYTIDDMKDEINTIINYFERNIINCINIHKLLLENQENNDIIYNMLTNTEDKIKVMKGMLKNVR